MNARAAVAAAIVASEAGAAAHQVARDAALAAGTLVELPAEIAGDGGGLAIVQGRRGLAAWRGEYRTELDPCRLLARPRTNRPDLAEPAACCPTAP